MAWCGVLRCSSFSIRSFSQLSLCTYSLLKRFDGVRWTVRKAKDEVEFPGVGCQRNAQMGETVVLTSKGQGGMLFQGFRHTLRSHPPARR